MNLKRVKFTTKLFVGLLTILFLSVLLVIVVNTREVRTGLFSIGKDTIVNTHSAIYNSIAAQHEILQEKLDGDMEVLTKIILDMGDPSLSQAYLRTEDMAHQVTRESRTVEIPSLTVGGVVLNQNEVIVDEIQSMMGGVATIFQVVDGVLLRVATNVMTTENKRAVGTYIPSDSPVTKAILSGQDYVGRAFVVNDWFVTKYRPLKADDGSVIGALFVGRQILTPQIRGMLEGTKVAGVGYFFVYDSKGEILVHPSLQSRNIFEEPGFGQSFKSHKDGFLEYEIAGTKKTSFTKFFEPWDWHIAVGLDDEQMVRGLDVQIAKYSALVGLAVLAFGVLVSFGLVRGIARPLNKIAQQSLQVADGDYTVHFDYAAKDAIGDLSTAMNTMVSRTKEMLREITDATHALASSSSELASISTQMTSNSNQSANMANSVSEATDGVSNDMNSVSAAMEQATVNMGTVAAAAEEMSATVHEIAQNAERAKLTTASAVVKSDGATGRIVELGEAAQQIGAVTATIAAISSQTNLLALNATIEAARAGEAGRGFAVVANEIKELAQQTAKATDDIRAKIQGIQSVTRFTVEDISGISEVIREVNDITSTIAAAVEEQSVTTRDIAENVSQASLGLAEMNSNVASSSSKAREISGQIGRVRDASSEMSLSSQTVQESAHDLSRLAERLTGLVSKFKV